jgi:phosphoribosylaminoimidazole-succinocarboxamide synthase
MPRRKVVILMGSKSDENYVKKIVAELKHYDVEIEQRIASAHRTGKHLQRILDIIYEQSREDTVLITVAGLSDNLSGPVAGRLMLPTIACPPDAEKYGEMKKFSSTATPEGIKVDYAPTPKMAAELAMEKFSTYNFSQIRELREKAYTKELQTLMEDAKLQGVECPLPMTLWKKGKVRDIYYLGEKLLINSSNRISAFDVNSVTEIEGKGEALNSLSTWWFKRTKSIFPNHFVSTVDTTMMLVKRAERIDIEWVARDYLYGSIYREYEKGRREFWGVKLPNGLQLAEELPQTLLTPTTKSEVGHDIEITKQQAIENKLVTPEEWSICEENTLKLYEFYRNVANQRGLIIPDFKIEMGRYKGEIIQIDEAPTHDSARIWIKKYHEVGKRQENWCLDKEFYRQFLIDSGIDPKKPPNPLPEIPPLMVEEIQKRVIGSYKVFAKNVGLDSLDLKSLEEVEEKLGMAIK